MYWLRLVLAGLVGGLVVMIGLGYSLSQYYYFTYNNCMLTFEDMFYPLSGTLTVYAVSPVTVQISVSNIVNSTLLKVSVEEPSGVVELIPGDVYEVDLYPGEVLNVTVHCGSMGIGNAPLPLVDVNVKYSEKLSLYLVVLLVVVLAGVVLVERRM